VEAVAVGAMLHAGLTTVGAIKRALHQAGMPCRPSPMETVAC
jgi:hypothetical protein